MPSDFATVVLNQGLDSVTPPLLREAGSLIDCLNYEMDNIAGYRRCDGYERYDGWTDGGFTTYYRMDVTGGSTPAVGQTIEGSEVEDPLKLVANKPLGTVVELNNVAGPVKTITFALYNKYNRFPIGTALTIGGNAYTVFVAPAELNTFFTSSQAVLFYTTIRGYMSTLRNQVVKSNTAIAGLYYGRDKLYKAIDGVSFSVANASADPSQGQMMVYNGNFYKYLGTIAIGGGLKRWEFALIGPTAPSAASIQKLDRTGANSGAPIAATLLTTPSYYAYMVYANNPNGYNFYAGTLGHVRRDIPIMPAFRVTFTNGGNSAVTPPVGLVRVQGGNVLFLRDIQVTSGSFAANNAVGTAQLSFVGSVDNPDFLQVGDVIEDVGTSANFFTVATISYPDLPGTARIKADATHYQWGTYNFLATQGVSGIQNGLIFGATGSSRGFWAQEAAYGNVFTQDDALLDRPKFVGMHCRAQLALAFEVGSVQLSVPGEPLNFNGVQGATETGMGDTITGMLESQGTSTIVFCSRSIARLSGVGLSLQQETISAKIGAFAYTCVGVGSVPTFTNQNGVSTLQATAAYGDFAGGDSTNAVTTRLAPKLIDDTASFDLGGVVCALPVRVKNQYRLILRDGTVYSIAAPASDSPKVMTSNLADSWTTTQNNLRIPLAWSSEVDDFGEEFIHVAWDLAAAQAGDGTGYVGTLPDPTISYRLDYGWGYDGRVFPAWFEIATMFLGKGYASCSIEQVRMYGMGYGLATLDVKSSGVEVDFDQAYHSAIQDLSMPITPRLPYKTPSPVTSIIDQANWGLGIKLRINNSNEVMSSTTEPAHICQVLQLRVNTEGALDS